MPRENRISVSSRRGISISEFSARNNEHSSVRDAQLTMEMRDAALATVEETQNLRPQKTQTTLNSYRKEFADWCLEKGFYDEDTVRYQLK